jgi:hypothetical protein
VSVSFLGRRIPLEYRIAEFERPSRLVLCGGDSSLRSIDEITFVSRPGGTRVTYEARLELTGIRRLADPILDLLFQRIGRLAVRGLRERLAGKGSHEPSSEGVVTTDQESDERVSTRRGLRMPSRTGFRRSLDICSVSAKAYERKRYAVP